MKTVQVYAVFQLTYRQRILMKLIFVLLAYNYLQLGMRLKVSILYSPIIYGCPFYLDKGRNSLLLVVILNMRSVIIENVL